MLLNMMTTCSFITEVADLPLKLVLVQVRSTGEVCCSYLADTELQTSAAHCRSWTAGSGGVGRAW